MPKADTPVNRVGNPIPNLLTIETDEHATAFLAWVFEHDPALLNTILGIFRCYRGLGNDPKTAFDSTCQMYAKA